MKKVSSIEVKQLQSCPIVLLLMGYLLVLESLILKDYRTGSIMTFTEIIKAHEMFLKEPLIQACLATTIAFLHNLYPLYKIYKYQNTDEYNDKPIASIGVINGFTAFISYVIFDTLANLHKTGKLKPITSRFPIDRLGACKNSIAETISRYGAHCDTMLRAYIPRYTRYKKKLKRAGSRLQWLTSKFTLTPLRREWAIKTAVASLLACERV